VGIKLTGAKPQQQKKEQTKLAQFSILYTTQFFNPMFLPQQNSLCL
jgi:hypothetical protein